MERIRSGSDRPFHLLPSCESAAQSVSCSMHRFALLILILFQLSCVGTQNVLTRQIAHLTILHWNDFHAQNIPWTVRGDDGAAPSPHLVGGAAALLGMINLYRDGRNDVAVFNAGDDFQGTPISSFTSGRSQVTLMNLIAPTAVTLGNHEFDYGADSIKSVFATTTFPVVVSNLVRIDNERPFALPYEVKVCGGVRLGIVGALPPDLSLLTFAKNIAGYRIRDIDSSLNLYIPILKRDQHVDLIILLSHMGVDQDTALALRRGDIDVIVGGHTHTALFHPIRKNRTVIVQAGSKGQYLGKLDLMVDLAVDSIVSYNGSLIETSSGSVRPDSAAAALVAGYEAVVESRLGETIGTLRTDWERQTGKRVEMNLGNFECDVTRDAAATDIAFQNVGGMRRDLPAGPIRVRDIWEINPFGNTIVTFSVRGDSLRKMLEWQAGISPREFAQVSGVAYVYDSSLPKGSTLVSASVSGRAIVDSASYSVATNNYIGSHLHDFFGISASSIILHETGMIDRDVIIAYVRKKGTISSAVEGRIVDRAAAK